MGKGWAMVGQVLGRCSARVARLGKGRVFAAQDS